MKITYTFADGTTSTSEVDEGIGSFIMDSRRQEANDDRRQRYHNYSLDAAAYEGADYGCWDKYSFDDEEVELSAHVREAFSHLSAVQRRRMLMLSKGMSLHEIAAVEGISYYAVYVSIEAARKKFLKFF